MAQKKDILGILKEDLVKRLTNKSEEIVGIGNRKMREEMGKGIFFEIVDIIDIVECKYPVNINCNI